MCQSERSERSVELLGVSVGEGRGWAVLVTGIEKLEVEVLGRGFRARHGPFQNRFPCTLSGARSK